MVLGVPVMTDYLMEIASLFLMDMIVVVSMASRWTTIDVEQINQHRFRVCLMTELGNFVLEAGCLILGFPVCFFHTGHKSFLSTHSSPVWVLWPFNGSFHLTALGFYYLPNKGPIVHRHEKIRDKHALSATATHHYFHPAISPSLSTMHYLTTYEDVHSHQVLWRFPPVDCLLYLFLHFCRLYPLL